MAHALRLINIVQNEEYDFYDREIMKEFEKEAHNETIKILNSPESISLFRSYSATNLDEFFSVAVECFFERSVDFRIYNQKLYYLLTKILKIDPAELNTNAEHGVTGFAVASLRTPFPSGAYCYKELGEKTSEFHPSWGLSLCGPRLKRTQISTLCNSVISLCSSVCHPAATNL